MELGADYVATGHYCRKIEHSDGSFGLLAGRDPSKDQSYFLCQLSQEQLSKALFPIGELLKSEVRTIAEENGLHTADKKDSQGLCFVGKISLPQFLQQKLDPIQGDIIELPTTLQRYIDYASLHPTAENVVELAKPFVYSREMGKKVAEHQGAHYYTIGQRRGLHIGGRPEPSFVIGLDVEENIVYSGQTDEHPGLNRYALKIELDDLHFVSNRLEIIDLDTTTYSIRIRYRQALQEGCVYIKPDGVYILFKEIQRGITPGQFAALYDGEELVASGVIAH
jgi:tRNA-specific 2-thiouridylase